MRVLSPLSPLALLALVACSDAEDPTPAASPGSTAAAPGAAPAAPAAPAREPAVRLQALVPTSGDGVDHLVDTDPSTTWKPAGSPALEGVLLRFEEAQTLSKLSLTGCSDVGTAQFGVYVNGADQGSVQVEPGATAGLTLGEGTPVKVRSVFLKAQDVGCLAEVGFEGATGALDVGPPRSVSGKVSATSTLEPDDAYHPDYLFDRRTDFGWVEGADDLGVGQRITLTLEQPLELHALEVWNGYQRSSDHFKKNARVKQLGLSVDGGAPVVLELTDTQGAQKLKLPAPVKGKVLTLEILGATPGSRYKDLVLSELRLWDAAGPYTVALTDSGARVAELKASVASSPLAQVVDQSFGGACSDSIERGLKLRSDHSFVYYEDHQEQVQSEVFDGTWVVVGSGSPWAEVQFYGRRHRTTVDWNPYGSDKVQEQVKIAGGKAKVARVADLSPQEWERLVTTGLPEEVRSCAEAANQGAMAAKGAVVVEGPAMAELLTPMR